MGKQTRERATVYDGDIVEIDVMPERKTGIGKSAHWAKTTEVQKIANASARSRYVRRLLEKNFRYGSMVLTLTFDNEHEPEALKEARAQGVKWWRRVKRLYRKEQIEPKCFFVVGRGDVTGRLHLHVLISGGVERGMLLAKWNCANGMWSDEIRAWEDGIADLAQYFLNNIDFDEYEHTYFRSRNMEEPKPEREGSRMKRDFDRVFTKGFCERLYKHDLTRAELGDAFPGYKVLDGYSVKYNVYNHGYFIHMRLRRVNTILPEWSSNEHSGDYQTVQTMKAWYQHIINTSERKPGESDKELFARLFGDAMKEGDLK